MRLSARVGLDSRETTPLTTGFLIYLKFLSVLKEEKNKKGNNSVALTALL